MQAHLTRRQFEVLLVFADLQNENGIAPTLKELGSHLGVNRVTVFGHAQALLEKGVLENLMPGASRGLEITEFGLALIKEQHPAESVHVENADYSRASSHTTKHQDENISVPFLGKIAAGGPILTVEDRRTVDIPKLLKLQPSTYLLKVSGDSMINAQIAHGDWVIVDSAKIPEAKDIVVSVITEGPMEECTLKTYLPIGNGKIKLQPENPDYEPSIFSVTDIQIRGVVTSVLRTLG